VSRSAAEFLLVIPAFRESKRLPAFFKSLVSELDGAPFTASLLVVDDGSGPEEQAFLKQLLEEMRPGTRLSLELLLLPENLGKGGAIRVAWNGAPNRQYEWIGFVDADGAVPASEVSRVLSLVVEQRGNGASYFASRVRMLGRAIRRNPVRHLAGRVFASIVGTFIDSEVYDSQCGFKVIRSPDYHLIADRLHESGFCFDVELLAALRAVGAKVIEIPIDWADVSGSKLHFMRDAWRMLLAVGRIIHRRQLQS
jgi:dolichyl-phosphate beta-glucosyltransferase